VSGSSESGAIGLDKAAPYQALWIGREELRDFERNGLRVGERDVRQHGHDDARASLRPGSFTNRFRFPGTIINKR
jgi:hypothetical protein